MSSFCWPRRDGYFWPAWFLCPKAVAFSLHSRVHPALCGSVVVPRLQDGHVLVIRDIDKAVCVINATGPGARQGVLEQLWFPDPLERVVPEDIFNKGVDALECLPVLRLPVQVVFPPLSSPSKCSGRQGSIRWWVITSPARAASKAESKRRAFAGERNR